MLQQGILRRAVVRGLIPANPVSVVDKPRQPPTRRPEPLPPLIVERIRAQQSRRDAALVSVLRLRGPAARRGDIRPLARPGGEGTTGACVEDGAAPDDQAARAARPGPGRMAAGVGATSAKRAHLPDPRRRRLEAPRLAELASTRLPVGGEGCGRHRRPARLPTQRLGRLAAALGPQSHVRRRPSRAQQATLAKHYAGVLEEFEDKPRTHPPRTLFAKPAAS